MLLGLVTEGVPSLVMHEVREIEMWILRLLSAPVCVPGKTKVEVGHNAHYNLLAGVPVGGKSSVCLICMIDNNFN